MRAVVDTSALESMVQTAEGLAASGLDQHWLRDCEQAWPTAAAALPQVLDEPCGGAADLLTLDIPTTQRLVHRRLDDGHLPAAQPSR